MKGTQGLEKELERELALDQLLQRANAAAARYLDATIDVKQRLDDLLRRAGIDGQAPPPPR